MTPSLTGKERVPGRPLACSINFSHFLEKKKKKKKKKGREGRFREDCEEERINKKRGGKRKRKRKEKGRKNLTFR